MTGSLTSVGVSTIGIGGLAPFLPVGARVLIGADGPAEIVAANGSLVTAVPFGGTRGLGAGAQATLPQGRDALRPSDGWIGRVVDPLGRPLDGRGPLPTGPARFSRATPPEAFGRDRLGPRLPLGVRALDLFTPIRRGQRLGLFAGSGVGKSTLLGMLARGAAADVVVLALVGERGREVREFLEDELGPEGAARACVVLATSDQPPLMRREAAFAATTVAEHFRDQGLSVLLLMDSVTRFCLALREIGLAAGEPPTTRGYPPSMFAELPKLLERSGPGIRLAGRPAGTITAIYTVLMEGGDAEEPVADAVRGILDGHVLLDRGIGEAGRYPAMDVPRSLSRTAPGCLDPADAATVRAARAALAVHAKMADLVRLGAYTAGTDPAVDRALTQAQRIEAILRQDRDDVSDADAAFVALRQAMEAA